MTVFIKVVLIPYSPNRCFTHSLLAILGLALNFTCRSGDGDRDERIPGPSDRWESDLIGPWEEADPILAVAGEARDREELVRRLEAL